MLNDTKLRALKPRPVLYRTADAHALAIEATPTGGRHGCTKHVADRDHGAAVTGEVAASDCSLRRK